MARILSRAGAHLGKILLVAFLGLPALFALLPERGQTEHRALAPLPARPGSWPALLAYPALFDTWVDDHFGFRAQLVALNTRLRYALFRQFPTIQVVAGKGDRIFLSTHQKTDPPYAAILSSCGYQIAGAPEMTDQINHFAQSAQAHGIKARMLIVPSAAVVQLDQLPDWLARRCATAVIPTLQILASPRLTPLAREMLYFPLAEMQAAGKHGNLFPSTWFHWGGAGPRLVAGLSVAHFWPIDKAQGVPLLTTTETLPSDLSHLFPGMALSSAVELPDFKASGIDACLGPACFATMAPVMEKLWQMSIYRNRAAPRGRLILISDSFGQSAAGWYARYYKEVVHVATNAMERLDEAQLRQMRAFLFDGAKNDDVLFLYHDVSVHSARVLVDMRLLIPQS